MENTVLYVHGKFGSADESRHFEPLFSDSDVIGLDYRTFTPWETGKEIFDAVSKLRNGNGSIILIANSIGAYFCMHAGVDAFIKNAYFISPIVDMELLITGRMSEAGVTEQELKEKGTVSVESGDDLSWEYLDYIRKHPVHWEAPTAILYGGKDELTSFATIEAFSKKHHAELTVMENGEHWFHTEEQVRFLDGWIKNRK